MTQDAIAWLIGLLAAAWLLRRWWPARWHRVGRRDASGCDSLTPSCGSGCGQCGSGGTPARDHRAQATAGSQPVHFHKPPTH